jgi:adenylyltransferase/sulfurtransferase
MLTHEEQERYSRQIILSEFGVEGQERLQNARVLIVGTGGLGSPAALYLAAMGVGILGIIDDDTVSLSNLHRQILYTQDDAGKRKVAAERLRKINPNVNIVPVCDRLKRENAVDMFRNYDLVLDGTDNFATRYLVNDAALMLGIPLISGSILKFEGQLTVVGLDHGPCYRCIFPEAPNSDEVPTCSEAGVLGALAGTMGTMMAIEAVKIITKIGEPLAGRLLIYNALHSTFQTIKVDRDPACPYCSVAREERKLLNQYEDLSCTVDELSWESFSSRGMSLIDVREEWEFQSQPSRGNLIPLRVLLDRIIELPQEEFAVVCASGIRSLKAVQLLKTKGIRAWSIKGGMQSARKNRPDKLAETE